MNHFVRKVGLRNLMSKYGQQPVNITFNYIIIEISSHFIRCSRWYRTTIKFIIKKFGIN